MLVVNNERIDQSWTVMDIVRKKPPIAWKKVFDDAAGELEIVSAFLLNDEKQYGPAYPLKQDRFRAFHLTAPQNIKVVIIGQDPYPQLISLNGQGVPRATGLSFSVRKGDMIPSSLKTIYEELERSVYGFTKPNHGDLTSWAVQGVLMLNICLTVRQSAPGSHKELWHGFITKVLEHICKVNPRAIFLLWGAKAREVSKWVRDKAIILEAAHP